MTDEVLADRLVAGDQPGLELARAKPGFHHPANTLLFAWLDPALHTPIRRQSKPILSLPSTSLR
jgi:hypothetical protein